MPQNTGGLNQTDLWPVPPFPSMPTPHSSAASLGRRHQPPLGRCPLVLTRTQISSSEGLFFFFPFAKQKRSYICDMSGGCQDNTMHYLCQEHSWQGTVTNSWFCAAFFSSKVIKRRRRPLPLRQTQLFRLHCSCYSQT